MSKRTKLTPEIVANLQQAEGALVEMASIGRKLALMEVAMNEAIAAAKNRAERDSAPLQERYEALKESLISFATLNKGELFKEKRTLDLAFGSISFKLTPSILQQSRVTTQMTLDRLHEYGLTEFIRVKEEINKGAMSDWSDDRLETVGLRRRFVDRCHVEPKVEAVKNAA